MPMLTPVPTGDARGKHDEYVKEGARYGNLIIRYKTLFPSRRFHSKSQEILKLLLPSHNASLRYSSTKNDAKIWTTSLYNNMERDQFKIETCRQM